MVDTAGTEITTPLGRIVWGDPIKPHHKTDNDNKKVFDDEGKPVMEISFGVAIPKADFQAHVWPAMAAEAAKGYPNGIPGNFAWKWTDGDAIDNKGKSYSDRDGYGGCYVLSVSTRFEAPPVMIYRDGAYYQVDKIKRGDYVQVNLTFVVNMPKNATYKPSLYVNPKMTLLCYEGDEIKGGEAADPTQAFGAAPQQYAPPVGARPVGMAPQQMQPDMGQPQMGQPMQQPAMQPQMQQQPAMQPQMQQQPAMQPQMQQQPAMQPQMQQPMQAGGMAPPATDFVQNAGMPGTMPPR